MSLSNLLYPGQYSPVRDPVWHEVLCNGYRTSAPVAGVYTLALVEDPTDGQEWSMVVGGTTITFTFVTAANDSGTQITIGGSTPVTLANLLTALRGNYTMDQAFSMAEASGTITMTARTPGALEVAFSNTTPVTLSFNTTTPAADGVYAANYTANVQVWVEKVWNSGIYTPIPSLFGTPDEDRRARWDLSESLLPYVGYDWPVYGATTAQLQRAMQRRFYVTQYESLGDPPEPRRVYSLGIRRAWYAGSRNAEHRTIQDLFNLIRRLDFPNPFLTYRGRGGKHEVSLDQQHYLAWSRRVAKVTDQQIYMLCVVNYTDNTTETVQRHTDTNSSGWAQDDVMLFPTGFTKLGLDLLQPTKTPYKYSVVIVDPSAEPISEVHTFYIADNDANEVHLEFISSLGVVESVRCVGAWTEGISVEVDAVKRLLQAVNLTYPSVEKSNRVHQLQGAQRKRLLSTGFMDLNELLAVMDVLMSPEQRLLDHARGSRAPLCLVGAEHVVRQQGTPDENLHALNLEFLEGDTEMAWSNRLAMPALPSGGGEDEFPDDVVPDR